MTISQGAPEWTFGNISDDNEQGIWTLPIRRMLQRRTAAALSSDYRNAGLAVVWALWCAWHAGQL